MATSAWAKEIRIICDYSGPPNVIFNADTAKKTVIRVLEGQSNRTYQIKSLTSKAMYIEHEDKKDQEITGIIFWKTNRLWRKAYWQQYSEPELLKSEYLDLRKNLTQNPKNDQISNCMSD